MKGDGAVPIGTGGGTAGWIAIENGIEVQFSPGRYRSGDYWLIPTRVATGAIEWPADGAGTPSALPPRGIAHHYAPLFILEVLGQHPFVMLRRDCRRKFAPLPCVEGPGRG